MWVRCPWCGRRDLSEFVWGDDASVVRPANAAAETDDAWTDYLYFRRGTPGVVAERWHHVHGCGAWFVVERDTRTNRWRSDG